eukprot:jgi/Orpsp1_1/1190341/evm.model.d7180000078390.1
MKNCKEIKNNLEKDKNNKIKMYDLENHNYIVDCNEISHINKIEDICYVIFTSGTTGKPKGTLISYYNIYNFVRTYSGLENENENKENEHCIFDNIIKNNNIHNILGISNFSFDASLIEILFSLVNGLNLILVDENTNENIDLLSKYMIENEVEFIQITPSRLKLLMENELFRTSLKKIKSI